MQLNKQKEMNNRKQPQPQTRKCEKNTNEWECWVRRWMGPRKFIRMNA